MPTPLLAVDNYANLRMYPSHTIVVTSEQNGHEKHELYSGRRDVGSYHSPSAANTDHNITITFNRPRAFNFIAFDRQHNLSGFPVVISISDNGFVTPGYTIYSGTLPAVSSPGNPNDVDGVRTGEGAWLKMLPWYEASGVRIFVDNMGAGLRPQLGNIFCGPTLTFPALHKPAHDFRDLFTVTEIEAEGGTMGRGFPGRKRQGLLTYAFGDFLEFEEWGQLPIYGHFGDGRPGWLIHDLDQAHRAVLAWRQGGEFEIDTPGDRIYRTMAMPWIEYEPKVAA